MTSSLRSAARTAPDTATAAATTTAKGAESGTDLSESALPLPATMVSADPSVAPALAPVPTERVTVPFSGDGEGVAELTWGQRDILEAMARQGWFYIGGTVPLPAGATVQSAADLLGFMVSRFPSLRTTLRFDSPGRALQELHGSGEVILDVFDLAPGADPDETVTWIETYYQTRPRDFRTQWPVQTGVLRHDGRLTHMIAISCHTVGDILGMEAMRRELETGRTEPAIGRQQLELAAWQQSPAGRRVTDGAMRYMEKVLRSVPRRPLPFSAAESEPRHWTGVLRSHALRLALPAISGRTAADTSAVLLALSATALGRFGLLNPAVIRPVSSNRFRPGLADIVSNISQTNFCVLDVAGVSIDEAVRRARQASMLSYKNSYFDPRAESALIGRLAREAREQDPDAQPWSVVDWAYFNDRRTLPSGPPPSSPAELDEARRLSTFRWVEKKENPYEPLFVHIDDAQDDIELTISADTRHLSPVDNEALAREIEAAAIEAAFDAEASTRVKAPAPIAPIT